jgi:hypothetical protein
MHMKLYVKKLNTGSFTFRRNGKRICVRSGEMVECLAEELGNQITDFVELKREERPKNQSILKSETSIYESFYRLKSWILNPDWKGEIGDFQYTPSDKKGLSEVLQNLQEVAERDKYILQQAWNPWKYQVESDPMSEKVLSKPDPEFIEAIARATAKLNITKSEIEEVQARLAALTEVEDDSIEQGRKKLFMKGRLKMNGGKYSTCDGYTVIYENGKPKIPELNISLRQYLDDVKKYRITKAAAKSAKSIAARKEFLAARKEKRLAEHQ